MCGIVGSLSFKVNSTEKPLEDDLRLISHRGPDGTGYFKDEYVRLGHTRLAIIDLEESANQPMISINGENVIVFNGEIYNYVELRAELEENGLLFATNSDTEVILNAYQHWGIECLARFRGMFAFAIWNHVSKELFMARDRYGEKPLFVDIQEDKLVFASELKAILQVIDRETAIDLDSLKSYLHYQYIPEPQTPILGIVKLPPAHYAQISEASFEWNPIPYWNIETCADDSLELHADRNAQIYAAIEDSVSICMRSDVPVGIALSGGIDSGVIAAIAQRASSKKLMAFSVGYPGHPNYDEREKAKVLADHLGMEFIEIEISVDDFVDEFEDLVNALDEPIADPAAYAHFSIPRAASQYGVKVLLSGLGSDEIFWGYEWVRKSAIGEEPNFIKQKLGHLASWILPKLNRLPEMSLSRKAKDYVRYMSQIYQAPVDVHTPIDQIKFYVNDPHFKDAFEHVANICSKELNSDRKSLFRSTDIGYREIGQYPSAVVGLITKTWLASNCLTIADRVGMKFGVETRVPFLDVKLSELLTTYRRFESDHKLGNKVWLRQAVKRHVPSSIVKRKKAGFQPPVHKWLSEVIERHAHLVNNGFLAEVGVLDKGTKAENLISYSKLSNSHLFFVYKLVSLEVWGKRVYRFRNT
jgi:asparagine synthase (glutamine-hydrolysing)